MFCMDFSNFGFNTSEYHDNMSLYVRYLKIQRVSPLPRRNFQPFSKGVPYHPCIWPESSRSAQQTHLVAHCAGDLPSVESFLWSHLLNESWTKSNFEETDTLTAGECRRRLFRRPKTWPIVCFDGASTSCPTQPICVWWLLSWKMVFACSFNGVNSGTTSTRRGDAAAFCRTCSFSSTSSVRYVDVWWWCSVSEWKSRSGCCLVSSVCR